MSILTDTNRQTSFTINKDGRVNFVLSNESFNVIKNDMEYFGTNNSSTLSSFLNSIFEPSLSIFFVDRIIHEHMNLYNSILSNLDSLFDSERFKLAFDSTVINLIGEKLKDYNVQKNGGIQVKFKLNIRNIGLLKEYEYHQVFENRSLSFFIRCIFESYTRLSIGERERLYYADFIKFWDRISIANGIIKYKGKNKSESLVPYKIMFNENTQRHYALGYLPVFNVPRIRQLKNFPKDFKIDEGFFKLSQEQISTIEKKYKENDLEYIDGNTPTDIYTVRFTEFGLEQFKQNTHGRPITPSPIHAPQKTFTSTDKKMLSYFLKFGPNIEILGPPRARELFKNIFKLSLEIYVDNKKAD